MNTKDEDGLCGNCKGSSFASGSGNSTYYAFCAKPIKEEEVVVKNVTKNNSLEAKYTNLQIDHKVCREETQQLEAQNVDLKFKLENSLAYVKAFKKLQAHNQKKLPQQVKDQSTIFEKQIQSIKIVLGIAA